MNLILFASHNGSNAENIANYFKDSTVNIVAILSNNTSAGVLERAKRLGIPTVVFNKHEWETGDRIDEIIDAFKPDLIVLAGFLWKFSTRLLYKYPTINIHPALLPKYGGKGMYGRHIHEEVIRNKETESGITIHWVNENYDEGKQIFQATCPVESSDTAALLAKKISLLEFEHFPRIIETLLFNS